MPRRQRKRKRRKEDLTAYREMMGRILAGEVRSLWWTVKRINVKCKVQSGMIYIMDPDARIERTVTAGSLRHFRVQSAECGTQNAEPDKMGWVKE